MRKCKSVLIHKIADNQLEYIGRKTSPREIWLTLKENLEKKGISRVFYLLKQLFMMQFDEKRILQAHILSFKKLVRELESANIKIDKSVLVFFLLQSMTN